MKIKVGNYIPEDDLLIKVSFALKVGDLIDSNIMQLLPLEFGKKLVAITYWGEMQKRKLRQLLKWHRPIEQQQPAADATTQQQRTNKMTWTRDATTCL